MRSRVGCIYKFFFQPINKSLFKYPIRLKSSYSSGDIIPVFNSNNKLSLGSIFQHLKNEYRIRQIAFNHQLQTSLDNGIENYKEKDFQKAQLNFGEIIKTLTGDEIADLSDKQKLILSKAFTYSAKILSLGNTNDSKLALTYLEQAVKLMPDYEEAVSMKKSIVAERNAYRP